MNLLATALVGAFLLYGTPLANAASGPVPAPSYTVAMTAYNAVPSQTDDNPEVTASGAYSDPNVVVARSQDLAEELPFGTVIEITTATSSSPSCGLNVVGDLIGYRVVADSMNVRMHQKIDILFGTEQKVVLDGKKTSAARAMGVCDDVAIRVVGHVDIRKMPKNQEELASAIGKGSDTFAVAK